MGADDAFYGLAVGATPLAALLGLTLNQWLLQRMRISFKAVLWALPIGSVLANTAYALAGLMGSRWILLFTRCVMGLCNCFNLVPMYISLTVGPKRRSEISFYFSAVGILSFAAGPGLAAVIGSLVQGSPESNLLWNGDTAPGWCMAILYAIFILKILVFFEDLPLELTASSADKSRPGPSRRPPIALTCAVIWYFCVVGLGMAAAEIYVTNAGQHDWDLSVMHSALLVSLLMLCSGVINLLFGKFMAPYLRSDRGALLVASLLACLACIRLYDFGLEASSGLTRSACVAVYVLLTLAGVLRACALSLSSKLVPMELKALMVTIAMVAQTIGRGLGAIVGAIVDQHSFAAFMTAAFAGTLLMTTSVYRSLRYDGQASQ